MQNRETGKTYPYSPMGGTPNNPDINDLVQRQITPIPTATAQERPQSADYIQALADLLGNAGVDAGSTYAPLIGGGDMNGMYAGLGDLTMVANRIRKPEQNDMYAAGLNFPDDTNIPNYYGEVNTPLGLLFAGTNDGNPNINAGFQPNDQTQYYIQALASLLNR